MSPLFWEGLYQIAFMLMDTRLGLFDLIYGLERTTPADEKRDADRNGLGAAHYEIRRIHGDCI